MWGTRSTLIWERSPLMYLSIGKIEMSMFAFELCYLCSGLKTTENFEKIRIWRPNSGECWTQDSWIEVYLASGSSRNDVIWSKNKFQKIHFPLRKMVSCSRAQARLVGLRSRSCALQTWKFLLGFVEHELVCHYAQGCGLEKQGRREQRSDMQDLSQQFNLARARARRPGEPRHGRGSPAPAFREGESREQHRHAQDDANP